jgi:hypothetical protein
MNTNEVQALLGLIAARYPASKMFEQDLSITVQAWTMSLDDVPADAVQPVLARWFKTEKWAPDPSELRALIAAGANPMPSEGEVWSRRYAYFRHGRGESQAEGDAFAFSVFRDIGTPADCGQMQVDDLRESVKWSYKRLSAGEKSERTAAVSDALQPAVDAPRLKAVS